MPGSYIKSFGFVKDHLMIANFRYKGDLSPALGTEDSDLVAGTYEGGLKVWECSEDLTRFNLVYSHQTILMRTLQMIMTQSDAVMHPHIMQTNF